MPTQAWAWHPTARVCVGMPRDTVGKEIEMNMTFQNRINRCATRVVLCVALCACASQAFAQRGPSFEGLGTIAAPGFKQGTWARGVSADGLAVIGVGTEEHDLEAPFRWTRESGFFIVPSIPMAAYSVPKGVSADGSVVVGRTGLRSNGGTRAFRWGSSTGTISLGDLPGGDFYSVAQGVSADGVVVVGDSKTASGIEAFRWTQSGGMVGLGFLPGLRGRKTITGSFATALPR